MSQKRLFSLVTGGSLSQMAKSSRGMRKGSVTLTKTRAVRKPSSGVKKRAKKGVTASQVATIAKRVLQDSAELKYFYAYAAGQTVGQVNGNVTGHNSYTFGYPSKGTSVNNRIGERIKIRGVSINALFSGMASQSAATKIACYLVWFQGTNLTVDIAHLLDPNYQILADNAVSVYDLQSFRDLDSNQAIKVLASWDLYLKESSSVSGNAANQLTHGSYQKYIPLNLTQTFDDSLDPASGELVLYTVSEIGNRSAGTVCTLTGVPLTGTNTGYSFQLMTRLEYTDI